MKLEILEEICNHACNQYCSCSKWNQSQREIIRKRKIFTQGNCTSFFVKWSFDFIEIWKQSKFSRSIIQRSYVVFYPFGFYSATRRIIFLLADPWVSPSLGSLYFQTIYLKLWSEASLLMKIIDSMRSGLAEAEC